MPLLKVFTRNSLRVSASELHEPLCKIWGVPNSVLKLLIFKVDDMSSLSGEDVYIDLRAKATPARTKDVVQGNIEKMSKLFYDHGHAANIRIELYEPSLQSAFWKAPKTKVCEDLDLHEMSDEQLRDLFNQLDKNGDGSIDFRELQEGLADRGLILMDSAIQHVMAAGDRNSDGGIDVNEFIAMSREE
eukprot:TRINITY_DN17826_c0_g1_i1.p1 TRINITY_DN17826_c0_g1~~TRINITY_DN17826_c0_g1_i1.p1  ORF type:complete len:188 (-),score=40.08 TRINITY_DN17826_c0_g1_i1:221-784(-)